jgi:hypothetical protein
MKEPFALLDLAQVFLVAPLIGKNCATGKILINEIKSVP